MITHLCILVLINACQHSHLNSLEQKVETHYNNNNNKIYDIAFKNLPNLEKYEHYSDYFTILFNTVFIPILISKQKYIITEYLGFLITILLIRSITISLTVLPKSNSCKEKGGFKGGCYDKIFSGHFASVMIATLLLYEYKYINLSVLMLINLINGSLILLTRHHYTIDIVVAFFVTMFVYQNNLSISNLLK
jgi:hypothetical protein